MLTGGRRRVWLAVVVFVSSGWLPSVDVLAERSSLRPLTTTDPHDPEFAGRYRGRVVGPDQRPLAEARVYAVAYDRDREDSGPVRAVTDAEGRFEFDAPDLTFTDLDGLASRQRAFVIATADGFAPEWTVTWGHTNAMMRGRMDPMNWSDITLQLARDDAPISGRFLDPAGKPLAGARVRISQLMIPRQRDLDAHLQREVAASVANSADFGNRFSRLEQLPGISLETETDADGRFTLPGLGRDRLVELSVSAPTVIDTTLTVMTRDAPDVATRPGFNGEMTQKIYGARFTYQLRPGLKVQGLVRDRETQQPIPGIWVGHATGAETPIAGLNSGKYPRRTDAAGRFAITGLDPQLVHAKHDQRHIIAVSPPGMTYQLSSAVIMGDAELLIEASHGIPYRLSLVDEQGRSISAEVTYVDIQPNPYTHRGAYLSRSPISRATQNADGAYVGFVLPGPGALLVKAPSRDFRPAFVDPKAFFAPHEKFNVRNPSVYFGTADTLSTSHEWINQHDYAAIVLVNPPPDSGPLQLSATVVRDTPRLVSLVDTDQRPVVGAQTTGLTYHPWDEEPRLRSATFPLRGLHPDRALSVTFIKEETRLIAFLLARADGQEPYTVTMQPWASVRGKMVNVKGDGLADGAVQISGNGVNARAIYKVDAKGQFRIERLVPGEKYRLAFRHPMGKLSVENLVLQAGEAKDLGDVRVVPPELALRE